MQHDFDSSALPITYAVQQRLRLIDFLLAHYGSIGRAEVEGFFGVGSATVTRDFALYLRLAPGNALLNQQSKRWVRSDIFKRLYA